MSKELETRIEALEDAMDIIKDENKTLKAELEAQKQSSVSIQKPNVKKVLVNPGVFDLKDKDGKKVKVSFALLRFTYPDGDGNLISTTAEALAGDTALVQTLYASHPSLFVKVD